MKKSSLFSVVALLATVAFLFTACPEEPEEDTKVSAGAIGGVTAPVTGGIPVDAVTDGNGYTGTVTWAGALDSDGNFAVNTVYTATITLSAKSGYTFDGFTGAFTVTGVNVDKDDEGFTNGLKQAASSGKWVVTAVFPATVEGDSPITSVAIIAANLPAPVTGGEPVAAITTATEYTAAIQWKPANLTDKTLGTALGSTDKFAVATTYAAVITLTAKSGYAFTGVPTTLTVAGVDTSKAGTTVVTGLDFAAGISKTLDSTTGKLTITAIFPATAKLQIAGGAIGGVTVPAEGETPVGTVTGDGYTGTVAWKLLTGTTLGTALTPSTDKFAGKATYVAVITLTADSDHVFAATPAFTVANVKAVTDSAAGDTATGLQFTNGLSQAVGTTAGTWVVNAIFPVTLGSVPASSITPSANNDVLTVTVTGGTFVDALKAYVNTDGTKVTIGVGNPGTGFTALAEDRVSVATTAGSTGAVIEVAFPNGAASTGTATTLSTTGVIVTLAVDAQVTQATTVAAAATTSAARTFANSAVATFPAATTIVNGITETVTLGVATTLSSSDVTVPAGVTLDTGTFTLTVGASGSGALVLTGAAGTGGAKLSTTGAGGVKAANTTITGIWQAVDASGSATITIAAADANVSSITASATTVVLTAGTGGTITQAAEASNNLTIAANTTIELTGGATPVGKIVLKAATTNPATLTLTDATSIISTAISGDTAGAALAAAAGDFVTTAADGKALCNTIDATTGVAIYPATTANTKLFKIAGGSTSQTITATASSASGADVTINASTKVTD
jgi:hypothetical protein